MKKLIIMLTVVLLSSATIAQHTPVFGLKGGVNVASWKVEGANNAVDTRLGFHAGLLAHMHLSDKIGLQPEIQFSSQGAENATTDDEYRTSYINIPVMLQYMFNNGFRIEAGPQIGFLIGAKDESPNGVEIDSKGDYKKIDAAIGVGLNYLTHSGFGFGGRYNFGISNINDRIGAETYNRVLQLSVFYMFDQAHKAKSR